MPSVTPGRRSALSTRLTLGARAAPASEVDQRALDSAARALAVEILSDTRNTDEIEHATYEAASEAVQLDIKIAEAEAVAEALTDRLGRGEITLARYDLVIKPVDERIASLRAE